MRVYYIGSGYDGCYYVRCMLPLQANGWNGDRITLSSHKSDGTGMMKAALNSDIIVFQRPLAKERYEAALILKEAGKKIVLDNDDTYSKNSGVPLAMFGANQGKVVDRIAQMDAILKNFAKISDMVTVTTEPLKKEYSEVNPNTVVLPNCVCLDDWDKPLRNETDVIRIGITGSVGYSKDYSVIKPILEELSKDPRYKLVLFSLPPNQEKYKFQRKEIYHQEIAFWGNLNAEWQPAVPIEDYSKKLNSLKLDIMLIPRADNYFNRCKSNVKFLEAAMLEIPVVAQGFSTGDSPYQDEEDAKNMIVCHTEQDWRDAIQKLSDKETRRNLGKQAHEYVVGRYDIEKNAHLWEQAYKTLL